MCLWLASGRGKSLQNLPAPRKLPQMSNKPSVNTALKTVWEYMGLISDYRKVKAIEAFNKLKEELKTLKQKHGNLEKENKRLKEALHKIADCGCPLVENEYGYTSELPECRRIAESVL